MASLSRRPSRETAAAGGGGGGGSGAETGTLTVHVRHAGGEAAAQKGQSYRLRNLALAERTVADLRRVLAAQTGEAPAQHQLRRRDGGALPAGGELPLRAYGLRSGDELDLTLLPPVTVAVDPRGGGPVIELRLHGIDPATCRVSELRQVVTAKMGLSPAEPCALRLRGGGDPLPDRRGGAELTLSEAGVTRGATLHAAAPGAAAAAGSASPGRSPSALPVQVASSWPSGCGVQGALENLRLVTDGLWTTDGALCRGGRPPPAGGAPAAAPTTVPLPALRGDAAARDLRLVVLDLLGLAPAAQLLFHRGLPLPPAGSAADAEPLRARGVGSGSDIQLAVDRTRASPPGEGAGSAPLSAATPGSGPWCVHCVAARHTDPGDPSAPVSGEWRPQFCRETWRVRDLVAAVAEEVGDDPGLATAYFRGRELDPRATLLSAGVRDGASCLFAFRGGADLLVELRLRGAPAATALLRGVPLDAGVDELCRRAAVAAAVPAAADAAAAGRVTCSVGGAPLPIDATLRECGVSHGDAVTCDADAAASPPASPPRLGGASLSPAAAGGWPPPAASGALLPLPPPVTPPPTQQQQQQDYPAAAPAAAAPLFARAAFSSLHSSPGRVSPLPPSAFGAHPHYSDGSPPRGAGAASTSGVEAAAKRVSPPRPGCALPWALPYS